MQQVAADALGLSPEKVTVRIGDTKLPKSHPTIGSATMANAGTSVMLAAKAAREKAIALACTGRDPFFRDADGADVIVSDGRLIHAKKNLEISYAELLGRNNLLSLTAEGNYDPNPEGAKAVFSFLLYSPR
jgi:xanthine dehydrogenase YagR molybdenum-binding subunit